MWIKFKWDMFVTSFIPLWISIIIFDLWDLVAEAVASYSKEGTLLEKLCYFALDNTIQIISITVIVIMVAFSICGINQVFKKS